MPKRSAVSVFHLGPAAALLSAISVVSPVCAADNVDPGFPVWRLDVAYAGDVLANARGGLRRGLRYLDNLDLSVEADGARIFGVDGLKLFAYAIYNARCD
jgi:porin